MTSFDYCPQQIIINWQILEMIFKYFLKQKTKQDFFKDFNAFYIVQMNVINLTCLYGSGLCP